MMKKYMIIGCVALLGLVGCSSKEEIIIAMAKNDRINTFEIEPAKIEVLDEQTSDVEKNQENRVDTDIVFSGERVKTGMGIILDQSKSSDATNEKEGVVRHDAIFAAVAVNEAGIIEQCSIDEIQMKVSFNNKGELNASEDDMFKTKKEMGDTYKIGEASSIAKEWDQQVEAVEKYVVGKTMDEVKTIAFDSAGVTTEVDLVSSATIKTSGYIQAVIQAIEQATFRGAKSGDRVTIGIQPSIVKLENATTEQEGVLQSSMVYAAMTQDEEKNLTSAVLDHAQVTQKINEEGILVINANDIAKTKKTLGDAYNMRGASSIGKEWFEQVEAFETFLVGKQKEAIQQMPNVLTDVDIVTACTISVSDFNKALIKCFE